MTKTTVTPFLWFDNTVPQAVEFYTSIFPDAKVEFSSDFMAMFELAGQSFYALNGGPQFKFTEAVSFQVFCDTQDEVDDFWRKLGEGGEEGPCGWVKDKFGLSWQVVPKVMMAMLMDTDRKKANRAMKAMLQMRKLDIAALQKAYAG